MATKYQISLRVKPIIEGLVEIDKLTSEIEELGGQTGNTDKEVKSLNTEFQKLQKQQNTTEVCTYLNPARTAYI